MHYFAFVCCCLTTGAALCLMPTCAVPVDLLVGAVGGHGVRGRRAAAAADGRAGGSSGDDHVKGAGVGCRRLEGAERKRDVLANIQIRAPYKETCTRLFSL